MIGEFERLIKRVAALEAQIEELKTHHYSVYKLAQAGDFTTTELGHYGDYGYQTTDQEIQINCEGTIRAITTAGL